MTTCDILLAHLCPLNNSSFPSPHIPLSFSLSFFLSFLLSLSFSESFLALSLFHPTFSFLLYPQHDLGSLLRFSRQGNRERRGNGIRRISASIKQELRDRPRRIPTRTICIYLGESYKSRLLSTAPWYVRQGVRKVSLWVRPARLVFRTRELAPRSTGVTEERASANARLVNARGGKLALQHESAAFR